MELSSTKMKPRKLHVSSSSLALSQSLAQFLVSSFPAGETPILVSDPSDADLEIIVIATHQDLRHAASGTKPFVLISMGSIPRHVLEESGAKGSVGPKASLPILKEVIEGALAGRPPSHFGYTDPLPVDLDGRDIEILERMASGEARERVAENVGLTRSAVEKRLSKMMKRLEEPTTESLIARACRDGLI